MINDAKVRIKSQIRSKKDERVRHYERHKDLKSAPLYGASVEKWKKRFITEKEYSEECAEYLALRLVSLIDHMLYGYALIAFHKQDATFQLAKATLISYEGFFHRPYEMQRVESTVVYWDVELQAWRSFQLENLLEWRPVC